MSSRALGSVSCRRGLPSRRSRLDQPSAEHQPASPGATPPRAARPGRRPHHDRHAPLRRRRASTATRAARRRTSTGSPPRAASSPSAHAHNVITLPSHTNILTGLYPYEHGVRENAGFRLSPNIETIATRLKARGFATGAFVGAFPLDSRYGLTRGFDVYEEMYKQTEEPEDFQIQQARADEVVGARPRVVRGQAGPSPVPLGPRLRSARSLRSSGRVARPASRTISTSGEVAYTDAALAPLLDAVTAARPAPLLVVTGDHGEARGEHGELTHGLFAYEATLHIPMLRLVSRPRLAGARLRARAARGLPADGARRPRRRETGRAPRPVPPRGPPTRSRARRTPTSSPSPRP